MQIDRRALEHLIFTFLCGKYVQRADDRQKAMGLQYTSAETHDLTKEVACYVEKLLAAEDAGAQSREDAALEKLGRAIMALPPGMRTDNPADGIKKLRAMLTAPDDTTRDGDRKALVADLRSRDHGNVTTTIPCRILRAAADEIEGIHVGQGDLKKYRHKKSGGIYSIVGEGKMQAEQWQYPHHYRDMGELETDMLSVDMQEVVIYRSDKDGGLWVRPKAEFFDGRFEEVGHAD